jgi:hypothetical protein
LVGGRQRRRPRGRHRVRALAEGGLVRREPQVGPAFEALELVAQAEVAVGLRHLTRGRSEQHRAAAWGLGPPGVQRGALIWASVVAGVFGDGGARGGSEEVWGFGKLALPCRSRRGTERRGDQWPWWRCWCEFSEEEERVCGWGNVLKSLSCLGVQGVRRAPLFVLFHSSLAHGSAGCLEFEYFYFIS